MFDFGHASLVARTELRRRWRATRGNALQLAALALAGAFYLAVVAAGTFGGHAAGEALAAGTVTEPRRLARYAAAALLVFPAFVVGFRTAVTVGTVDALDGLLTTVPHGDLLAGLALAEAAWLAGLGGAALLPATAALAVGAGSVALGATTLLAAILLGAVGVAVGVAGGLAVRVLLSRSAFVARNRTALGALAFLAYMALLTTRRFDDAVGPVLEGVRRSPVGWYADLALAPAAVPTSSVLAGSALLGAPLACAAGFAASSRLAAAFWYGDHARADGAATGKRPRTGLGGGVFERVGLSRPVARVAHKSWLRARRAPLKLVYVVYPLFVVVGPLSEAVESGAVPPTLPAFVALYGAWATAAAFTLNPLGDEGAVLPVTLTTPVTGRSFVAGLLVAGAVVGVPVTALLGAVLGVLSPLSLAGAAGVALAGGVLCVAGSAVAAAAGAAFPKFEASNVTRSTRAVVPSLYAFGAFSLALTLLWLPAGAATVAAGPLADAAGVSATAVTLAGAALTVSLAGAAGWLAARYAARRFDAFRL